MTDLEQRKQRLVDMYTIVEGSVPQTLEAFMAELGTGPAYPYPVSSVERNMFLASWEAKSIVAGLHEAWESSIHPVVAARLLKTPYTRYSGD